MADKLPSGPKVSGMDIVDAFLSKMKTETKQDGGTIEYNIKVEGTDELQKANELIEKFHKLNKQSKGNYFTSEAKGLENVTDAFERYTKAQSEYDKKIARGDLVRWTNAYKARDDFDQSKISQQVLDTASEAEKVLNGSSGRGYIHYSVDSFRELFSVMKEMQDTGYYDMGQFSKNFNAIPKAAKDAASQARKQMEQTPIITEDMIINSNQVKARISELETSISDFYNRYQKESELIKKGEARQYIKNLQELEDLYSLTNSDKYIDDKFFDLRDDQLLADYPGINMERIKKEVDTSINQFKKSIKNSLSGEMRSSSGQTADDFTQAGEAASTATTQVNEFNEAVNRGSESPKQSGVAESFTEAGQAAEEATEKIEKFDQTARGKQNKSFMTEQEQAIISEEYKASESRVGAKAGNIKQLREQYQYLTLLNESIKNWKEYNTGVYGPMRDSLENLEKYKAEILEKNPQLQSVSDHIKGNRLLGGDFKREFASFFPSFDALEEMYDHITELQQAAQDATKEAKPTYVKKLNEQRKAFVDMYEAYNEMTNGKMDVDVPGKKNITDMRNMYIALKDGLKATQETVRDSGVAARTPQFVETADAVGQAAESATDKVRELNSEMQNTSSSTTSEAVAGVSKEFEELETAINNTQNKYAQAIFNKSFTTKNKTAAQAQLKENYLAMQDILEADDWDNLSQRGEVAAYNYLKSFQEAVQKGVRPQMLEKYTIDAFKTFDGESYLYDKYAKNTSAEFDLQLEDRIDKLKAFTSIMDEMKTKYPDADLSKRSEISGKNALNEMLEYANTFNRIRSNKTDDTGLFDFEYWEDKLKTQKEYIDSILRIDQAGSEYDKFSKHMPEVDDFNDIQTYTQASKKYDSLATEISTGSKTAEQAIAELNAEIEKLNGTTSQAEMGQSHAESLNAEADAARNDAEAQRELADAKKEADSQVSSRQPTAMSDTTKELRKVWYHGTNETFDEFDVSKNEQATYGAGGYLTDDKKMAQTYGKNVMEFFADISNAYVEGSELSKEQIQKVWDEYGQYLGELQNSNKFKNLSQISKFDVSTIEGFGNFLNNPKTSTQFILNSFAKAKDKSLTSTDIFKSLGYDSYYYPKNDILNIFDSKNIIKATDEVKNSLQQYGDVRREVAQVSASAPGGSEQAEQFEQEAKAAKQATDAERELANARKETTPQTAGQSPISSGTTTKFFRGVDLRGRESLGNQGIYGQGSVSETPWFSSSLDIAKEYAGVLGEIYSLELDTNKIMTIDAQGEKWTHVLYLGQGEEEESKRLLSLYESLSQAKKKLQEDFGWDGQNDSLLNIMKSSTEAQRAVMEYQRLQMDFNKGINASDKYGYTSTDDLAKMAKEMGYQAIVIKNVMDSESGIIADNMSLLTGSMDGVKNASLQDLSGNVIETYNQEAEAARNNADAQKELAAAKKEVGSQSNETPVSQGATSAEAQAQANRDEAASAREAATAEQERATAAQQANDVASQSTSSDTSAESAEASAQSHERAAAAAQEHAEAARQANEVEGQKPAQTDTSNSEAQTQANEQEAESAQQAAEAEKERANAAQQANQTAGQVTATSQDTTGESSSMETLANSVNAVTDAVNNKTIAFQNEQDMVEGVVAAEMAELSNLETALGDIGKAVEELGGTFKSFGENSAFSSMFGDIKDNADTIKNFSDILKTSKEAREQAMKDAATAKEATDKVINEEKVDPSKWADFIKDKKDLDKLINELGGTVDVRRQTRVSEKTGEQYISYALKGEKGNAIIGKNGHILRTNIDEDMALSQQKEAAKQHANDVKSSYNDLISAMKEYGDAAEHVNKLQADIMSGKDVTDDEMDKALERRDKAAQNYIEKLQTIKNLVKEEGFTDKQIEGINRTADEVTKQIKDSEDNITIAANNKEYQDQIEIIQKAIEARNEYNKMLANEANGQIIPKDDKKRITATLKEAEDAKAKALDTIKQLREEQRISEEQLNAANTKYEKGTKASYDNLDKAMSNKVKKQEQAIERYDNAVQKAQAIQDKYNVGEATAKQLQNAIDKTNEYKTSAEEAMGVLIKMHDEGSKFVPDETIDKYRTILDDAKETSGIFGIGDNNGFETAERGYQTLIKNAERYAQIIEKKNNGQALTFNELSFLSKYGEYYQQAAENAGIFKNAQTEATESMEEFNRVMADAQNNAFQGTLEKMGDTLADFGKNTWNDEGVNSLKDLKKQYDELIANVSNYKDLSKEEQQAFRQRVTDLGNNISQLSQRARGGYYTGADEKDAATLKRRMEEWMYKNSAATEYFPQIQNLQDAINGASAGNLDEIAAAFERIKTQATEAGDVGKSFGETLKGSFKGMARYLLTYADLYEVINIAKQGVNIVRELDTALTEMRKVSDEPLSVLKDFAQHGSFEAADRVGTTSKQIQESTADWLRLGESFEQAQKSAELSTVLLNVSEFQDINAATESLTAMSQAYKDLDKSEIIDKLNYVGRFCLITQ